MLYFFIGHITNEMTIQPNLFHLEGELWKVVYSQGQGTASLVLKLNSVPHSGRCYVFPLSGFSLDTRFTLVCDNWRIDEGTIQTYAFYGKH